MDSLFLELPGPIDFTYFVSWRGRDGQPTDHAVLPQYERHLCDKFKIRYSKEYKKSDWEVVHGNNGDLEEIQ